MLIFINPKSEYRNPKQYLNTKFQTQNKHIAMYLQIVTSIFEKKFSLSRVLKCIKNLNKRKTKEFIFFKKIILPT